MRSLGKLTSFLSWFLVSVGAGELKFSGAELLATVAPAEPSLNDSFCSFVWDSHAQNAMLLYILNTQFSREVD